MRRAWVLAVVLAACGGSGDPMGETGEGCGPVDPLGERPNTLKKAILEPATLKKSCSPYALAEPVSVRAALTVEPGVTILACMGGCRSRITVARNGSLTAVGTAEEPIVFTSVYRDNPLGPARGQWSGLLFLESQPGSRLEHVVIEHGGGPYDPVATDDEFGMYEFPKEGSLLVDSTAGIVASDVRIVKSRGYAVGVTTSDEFTEAGLDAFATLDRLVIEDVERGLWLPVDQTATLGADLSFPDRGADVFVEAHLDDVVGRSPEGLRRDATWHPYAAPWLLESLNIDHGALLTVEDGVELAMTGLGGIFVGVSGPGALDMRAAAPGGITVRSLAAEPLPRDRWDGLYIWDQADGARTQIVNVDLGWGGKKSPRIDQSAPAVVGIFNEGAPAAQPTLRGVHVHDSLGAGIHWNCLAAPAGLEPANEGNTADTGTIACAGAIGDGIAENYNCGCPGSCLDRCPQPDP